MLLSEMFGVKREVPFKVKGYIVSEFRITVYGNGVEHIEFTNFSGEWELCHASTVCDIIAAAPAGIIHLPPPLPEVEK